ncbi:MAG: nicotinamide-nucleotide adenylyltransferase [Nitrososphaeria archaeon]
MKYKSGLFVGRFQPLHNGHLFAVEYALERSEFLYIGLGSSNKSHEERNPFTAAERIEMIKATLDDRRVDPGKWMIIPIPDVTSHYIWTKMVKMLVPKFDVVFSNDPLTSRLFAEEGVKTVEVPLKERERLMATEIRNRIVNGLPWEDFVPKPVERLIKKFDGEERIRKING